MERALAETEGPLRITSECIYHREGRKGIDLVNDAPENALMKEIDVIKASQDRMRKTLEQVGPCYSIYIRTKSHVGDTIKGYCQYDSALLSP